MIYTLWYLSGGVERGERRHAEGYNSFFIGVDIRQGGEPIGEQDEALLIEESEQDYTAGSSDIE